MTDIYLLLGRKLRTACNCSMRVGCITRQRPDPVVSNTTIAYMPPAQEKVQNSHIKLSAMLQVLITASCQIESLKLPF
jgi:hypothetical protein